MKPWRLTPQAEKSLVEIALWTLETFGPVQADIYERELIDRCAAVADGRALSQDCSILVGEPDDIDLRFTRAGEHFAVFLDLEEEIVFIDFLHARSDLPARIRALQAMRQP